MNKVFNLAIINKTVNLDKLAKKNPDEVEEMSDEEIEQDRYDQTRTYKGLCTNQYVDVTLDDIIQKIIHAKGYVLLKKMEDNSEEFFSDDADTIVKDYPNGNLYERGESFLTYKTNYYEDENGNETTDGSGFYDFDEKALYESLAEDYREEMEGVIKLSDGEINKLYKKLLKFYNDCDPRKYHYNEEFDILTIRDPKPGKKGKKPLPEKFVQLVISLAILAISLVVGLAVLPNVIQGFGWAIGMGVVAIGLATSSIILKPTPAVRFFKICLLGFKVWRGLDMWQREHMSHTGAAVIILFPLFFLFAIIAFVVTLVVGLFVGILMPILTAIVFLIPYQIMGWANRL